MAKNVVSLFGEFDHAPGRVVVKPGDPLYDAMRPSRECLEEIDRLNRANAVACLALRDFLIGSQGKEPSRG